MCIFICALICYLISLLRQFFCFVLFIKSHKNGMRMWDSIKHANKIIITKKKKNFDTEIKNSNEMLTNVWLAFLLLIYKIFRIKFCSISDKFHILHYKRKWDFIIYTYIYILFFFCRSDKMSQWCVFPISWHLNILGNYVITRYYRLFGMVFTEIYRIIWNKKKCLVSTEKKRELSFTIEYAVAYTYLFILSICKYTTATCDGYLRISFNIEKVFYLQFHLTIWLPFFFFIVYPNYL